MKSLIPKVHHLLEGFNSTAIFFDFSYPEYPNSAFIIAFETNELLGSVSIWGNGFCDVLVYEIVSEKEKYNKTIEYE